LQPQNAEARLLLGKVQVRLHQCSQAVAALEPVVVGPKGDSSALFLLWQAYHCAGDNEHAQQTMARFEAASKQEQEVRENKTQADHLVQQAENEALADHLQPAMDFLQQALAKQPDNVSARILLAKIYYSLGRNDDACEIVNQALKIQPFAPEALFVLGKVLEREGKLDEALEAFRQTTIVNPAESDAYYEMGLVYRQKNDKPRAVEAVKKALQISPDDPDYRRALAQLTSAPDSH
jgi:tetratricopeptide (TPR) repeat protein